MRYCGFKSFRKYGVKNVFFLLKDQFYPKIFLYKEKNWCKIFLCKERFSIFASNK